VGLKNGQANSTEVEVVPAIVDRQAGGLSAVAMPAICRLPDSYCKMRGLMKAADVQDLDMANNIVGPLFPDSEDYF
jgi:hypothetical protein